MKISADRRDSFWKPAAHIPIPEDLSVEAYIRFLEAKAIATPIDGIEIDSAEINPLCKPHQKDTVYFCLCGGRRAAFLQFGLGKTFVQLEIARILLHHIGGRFLIVCPLNVVQEFEADIATLNAGMSPQITAAQRKELRAWQKGHPERTLSAKFVRSLDECGETGLYFTNYETVRDGKLDPKSFGGASLDEASCLRGFGGTKTFREFMRLFDGMRYKFVATATPSPNELIELLAYAAFLEIGDVSQFKTRFFKRDSTKADNLTLHPHKKKEFYLWCSKWALFLEKPSDLGYSDKGYDLPGMDVFWHEVASDHTHAGEEVSGQIRMLKGDAIGVVAASREKRDSQASRLEKLMELRALDPGAHRIIWHDLEDERELLGRSIRGLATIYGKQDLEERKRITNAFRDGEIQELASKAKLSGSGSNFQRHCSWEIFFGIGFKFNDFLQAIYRVMRFLQTKRVRIDLIYTEAERQVRRALERKWEQHKELMAEMSAIIKEFGLAQASMRDALRRTMTVERLESSGEGWGSINNDCVLETKQMDGNSVHLVLTSIPFSTQYEYSPSYMDFGHTDSNEHFWTQMHFLIPELYRVLKPGRIACIHVKDRIIPSGIAGRGFQEVYPFHLDAIMQFTRHGFGYLGMKTIVTDVVRENAQTYRLGWSEQCKDGTKMGVGMPEYLLIFRKPPTDTANSYADEPVLKKKPDCVSEDGLAVPFERDLPIEWPVRKGYYSRMRWQVDAHGYARSRGDRSITPEEIRGLEHAQIFKLFKKYSLENIYDYEYHVRLGESMEAEMRLPVTFMLMQPQSWSDEVWADVTRMMTLNASQARRNQEQHLCPMQFDTADRAIIQFSNEGELVFDPFAGISSVPYRALLLKRRGLGVELSRSYWMDGIGYLKAAEEKMNMPSLFDLLEEQPA